MGKGCEFILQLRGRRREDNIEMDKNLILSICIPTHNRAKETMELIEECLKINARDIEICVTDQNSTDGTVDRVKELKDERIRVVLNDEPMIGYFNMVQSIYNAKGKYALYINDRDILDYKKVNLLIELLREREFAFLKCCERNKTTNGRLNVYHNVFESLIEYSFSNHPTGLVFNRELIEEHISRDEIFYYEHPREVYYWDFLARELFKFGKTAIWNNGLWWQRSSQYLKSNKSGVASDQTKVYFLPQNRILQMKQVMYQIFEKSTFQISEDEKFAVAKKIIDDVSDCAGGYKWGIGDYAQCGHYGLHKKYISLFQRLKIDLATAKNMAEFMKKRGYPDKWIDYQKSYLKNHFINLVKSDFRMNLSMIKRDIKGIIETTRRKK